MMKISKTQPIKILHVLGRMQRGGAEMLTLQLMYNIDRSKYQFHFCVLTGMSGELDNEILLLGGKIHYCKLGFSFPWRFKKLLSKYSYDVVNSHVQFFSGFILWLAKRNKIRIRIAEIHITHDGKGDNLYRKLYRRFMRYLINQYATNIIGVSKAVMYSVFGRELENDSRYKVIYSGIDHSRFAGPHASKEVELDFGIPIYSKICIHIGNMHKQKNHLRLISIFREISNIEPKAILLLVGRRDSEIEQRIRSYTKKHNISEKVFFAGTRPDIPCLLKASALMIFPSLWEGLPIVVLEACASGTPTLASNLPGILEVDDHFPLVHCLSLDDSDKKWAEVAFEILNDKTITENREATIGLFTESKFNFTNYVQRKCDIWQGKYLK